MRTAFSDRNGLSQNEYGASVQSGWLITIGKLSGIPNREKVRLSGNNQNRAIGKSLQSGYRDKLGIGKIHSKSFDADMSSLLSGYQKYDALSEDNLDRNEGTF